MLMFDTREEFEEVMAFVDTMKERRRERKERERPANLEDLHTLSQFIISELTKTQLPDLTPTSTRGYDTRQLCYD